MPFSIDIQTIGDDGVGKTCLKGQYHGHAFPSSKREVPPRIENTSGNLNLVSLNVPGRRHALRISVQRANGVMVVFDLNNRESFDDLESWITAINQSENLKVLVGNKCDLVDQRAVSHDEAEQWAARHDMKYFETTATDHDSTRAPIVHIVRTVVAEREAVMTSVQRAASCGDVAAIEQAIRQQADQIDMIGVDGWTAMHHAAKNSHVSAIEALVRLGSTAIDTLDKDDQTAMLIGACFGHVSVIEALVRLGSTAIDTPDKYGWTPKHSAAEHGHVNVLELLVRLGSKAIDTPDFCGWTPMFAAAAKGHVSTIEALVRLGSNAIDTSNKDGWTPMHAAASKGHVSAIETLVRLGSKAIDTPDNNGCTPLFAAASEGHLLSAETLLRLGSKAIDTPDNTGLTPVRFAIEMDQVEVIEALVRMGSRLLDDPATLLSRISFLSRSTIKVLKALGVSHASLAEYQPLGVNEAKVLAVRYRVHFSRSLTDHLLVALQRGPEATTTYPNSQTPKQSTSI